MLADLGDLSCATWSAARMIRALLEAGRPSRKDDTWRPRSEDWWTSTRRCHPPFLPWPRLAAADGDLRTAARLMGHSQAQPDENTGDVERCRQSIAAGPSEDESRRLMDEGAAADLRQVLGWIQLGESRSTAR